MSPISPSALLRDLNHPCERDYFRLRERIETARSQIAGLQEYIRNVCLAK
ncbi:lysis system i-spanin subunit Rz [Serratia sp. IR-2025]